MDNRPVVSNLDFNSLKQDLVDFYKSKPEFKDYEFTGSSLNLLMDILAYNTHYNSLAANFLLNESFIDTSLIRSNVVSLAKSFNYVPRSAKCSTTKITLNIPRVANEGFYILPAGSYFTSSSGNVKYNFYTIEDYTVNFIGPQITNTITVDVYEGVLLSQTFINSNSRDEFPAFDLGQTNIDTSTLTLSVNGIKHVQVTPETEGSVNLDKNSRIYFVEETRTGTHRVILGNSVIGKKPDIGNRIVTTFIKSSGAIANGSRSFSINIPGRTDITISGSVPPSQGGSAPESLQSIKDNAPHWYQSQYRAVTENDYKTLLTNKFSDIRSINVYGGEKINQPGKVFIAIRPKSADKLTTATKDTLLTEILNKTSVVTVRPEFVDPFILKIVLKTVVIYNEENLVTNRTALKSKIETLFSVLNNAYIGNFMDSFRESYLSSEIQNLDSSILGSNSRVSLRVDVTAQNGLLDFYSWTYNNRLYHPNVGFNSANGGVVTSNLFYREGRNYQSGFDDDGYGHLRLFDFIDQEKITVNDVAGYIDYETGKIDVLDFDPADGEIRFTAIPDSFDVEATENIVLEIATDDSNVDVIEKSETNTIKNLNLSRSI
jgi:hypothetical protein